MPEYRLKLYITGHTLQSVRDIAELKRMSGEEHKGVFDFTVLDILETPEALEAEKIVRQPALLKELPPAARRILINLTDREQTLVGVDITRTVDRLSR